MSLLDRYKKPGGFVQLLSLLETCGEAKKEKFLSMILEENAVWHEALQQRVLTLPTIMGWPTEVLAEATSRSMPITIAAIAKSLSEDKAKLFLTGLSHSHIAKIREVSDNKAFSNTEITSSIEKFVGETRKLITQGVIKLEKFAPDLVTPEKIEDHLDKLGLDLPPVSAPTKVPPSTGSTKGSPSDDMSTSHQNSGSEDTQQLRKQVLLLQKEVQQLRQDNLLMKDKLEKIRKIA